MNRSTLQRRIDRLEDDRERDAKAAHELFDPPVMEIMWDDEPVPEGVRVVRLEFDKRG